MRRRKTPCTKGGKGIGQAGIGSSIRRIFSNGRLKALDGLCQFFCAALVRVVTTLARLVIKDSVKPSAKYSCSGSPDRFSRGRTATERILPGPGWATALTDFMKR